MFNFKVFSQSFSIPFLLLVTCIINPTVFCIRSFPKLTITRTHRERQSVKEKVREDGKAAQCSTSCCQHFRMFVSVCQCAHTDTLAHTHARAKTHTHTCISHIHMYVCMFACICAVRLRFRFQRRTWHIALPLDRCRCCYRCFCCLRALLAPVGNAQRPQRANNI